MNSTTKKQRGFSALIIILLIALVGVIGFVAWRMYDAGQQKTNLPTPTVTVSKYDGWQTYTEPLNQFTIKHPDDWTIKMINNAYSTSRAELRSPQGTTLHFASEYMGGLGGGGCMPAPSDKPYQPGNSCDTIQDLSAEKLDAKTYIGQWDGRTTNYIEANVYLITRHYMNSRGDISIYYIGLRAATEEAITHAQQPSMEPVYFSTPYIPRTGPDRNSNPTQLLLYASSNDLNFLTSPDAETIKDILRTFTLK